MNARHIENEFRVQAGLSSTWRWYAKKMLETTYWMRFPTTKKVEDLSFFIGMHMRTMPEVTLKVEKWNSNVGAKAEINTT